MNLKPVNLNPDSVIVPEKLGTGFIKDTAFPVPVPNLKPDEELLLISVVVAPNLNPSLVIDPPRLGTTAAALGLGPATTERNSYLYLVV